MGPAELTGFYERRQRKVEEYLDIFGHTEEEKAYLLQMNDRVEEPFVYHWLEGWKLYLTQMLNDFGMVMAVFIALVSGLAIVYLPMALTGYMPMQVQRVFDLIPLVGSPSDIFRTNVFHMFGQIIWSPYLLITIPVILGCAFIPFTVRRWAGRLKR